MHMMGFLGALCVVGSLVAAVLASYSLAKTAQVWGYGMALATARPGLVLSLQLLIMGLQVYLIARPPGMVLMHLKDYFFLIVWWHG